MNPQNDEKVASALDFLTKPQMQRMAYNTFYTQFLPFFDLEGIDPDVVNEMLSDMSNRTGAEHTEKDLMGNLIGKWVEYVPSPFKPTEIIDGDGSVVYVVPPILDNSRASIEGDASKIYALVDQASNQAKVHPSLGDRFIKEKIIPLVSGSVINIEYVKMWNVIFDHHGMKKFNIGDEEKVVEDQKPIDVDDSVQDLEYDD